MLKIKHYLVYIYIALSSCSIAYASNSTKCSTNRFCGSDALGEQFDYRGQSTFGRLSPGDTTRVKVVLYSNNDVRIALCSDQILGDVSFKVIKTIREYNRIVDRIEKYQEKYPVYKRNTNNEKIPVLSENGAVQKDAYGDIIYEVDSYTENEKTDTIWKTERNIREEILFDSQTNRQSKEFFQQKITKTFSVIIEVAVPPYPEQENSHVEGCVGIMVGRRFSSQE